MHKALHDRLYEKRKAAALELEKYEILEFKLNKRVKLYLNKFANQIKRLVRLTKAQKNPAKTHEIIDQLCEDLAYGPSRQANSALGGLIGLAAVAIALGQV